MKTFISALVFLLGMGVTREDILTEVRVHLEGARVLMRTGLYSLSVFHAHQAAEFALKSVFVSRHEPFPFTHDVGELAQRVRSPRRVVSLGRLLAPIYSSSRYWGMPFPVPSQAYTKFHAQEALKWAEVIIRWAQSTSARSGHS